LIEEPCSIGFHGQKAKFTTPSLNAILAAPISKRDCSSRWLRLWSLNERYYTSQNKLDARALGPVFSRNAVGHERRRVSVVQVQ